MIDINDRLAQLSPQQRQLLLKKLVSKSQNELPLEDENIPSRSAIERAKAISLSAAQQRIWFFERLQTDIAAHNLNFILELEGKLNFTALESAFTEIIKRHDALRTYFFQEHGKPFQAVFDKVDFSLEVNDLVSLTDQAKDVSLKNYIKQELQFQFDLTKAPLLRASLVRVSEDKHVLVVILHHIIADDWSISIMSNEIELLYNAFCCGQSSPLKEISLQYSDIVCWQFEEKQQHSVNKQLSFWQKSLSGTTGLLNLPTDFPRSNTISLRGAQQILNFDKGLIRKLNNLANQQGVTLFMLLLAAFQTLLSRHSGQDDVVVGSPVANRNQPETQPVVGLCVNTLALRGDLSGDPSFRELLLRTRLKCIDALSYADVPLDKVVDKLKLERVPGRTPLFQTMFVLQNSKDSNIQLNNLVGRKISGEMDAARFEITLSISATENELSGTFDYNCDLFSAATMCRFAEQFNLLLESIVINPECQLSRLPILSNSERETLLEIGYGGKPQFSNEGNLYQLVSAQAKLTPDAIAVADLESEITYSLLVASVNNIANKLIDQGVVVNSRVATLADRSIESLVAVLATLAAGATYIPLDSSQSDERLIYILADAEVKVLLIPPGLNKQANRLAELTPSIAILKSEILSSKLTQNIDINFNILIDPQSIAYIIYTSGSTGTPKGVMVSHQNALNLVHGFLENHQFKNQRLLMIPPLIFDASVGDIFPVLAVGSTLILHPTPTELGAVELVRFCKQYQVTAIDAPAALWRRWTDTFDLDKNNKPILNGLNLMMFGGESVPLEQVKRFAELTGNRVKLSNHYGPTEASVCATMLTTIDGAELSGNEMSIGKPLSGVSIYIVDKNLQLAPRGVIGEICIGGIGVTQGYLGAPDLTSERFMNDPFTSLSGGRMYRSGDLARWDEQGCLQFFGRRDQQVKLRGFRIELGEIETAISAYPGVHSAIAKVCEIQPGDRRLVAYYVADKNVIENDLKKYLHAKLADAMLPSFYQRLDSFILTSNGKVDRRVLPAPKLDDFKDRELIKPNTETEHRLLLVWQDLLAHKNLCMNDEFFDVGGDSLLTLPLVYKINQVFAVDVPLTTVFIYPTIAGLAKVIDDLKVGILTPQLDLISKVKLPLEIHPDKATLGNFSRAKPSSILITGATGFLGAYLLRDLLSSTDAEILCLVRAATIADGLQRIKINMQNYGLWQSSYCERLVPLLGDLGAPLLGLGEVAFQQLACRAEVIFHNGGQVNFLAPYENMEAINVFGTVEVLRLATSVIVKPVHMVSTLGIYLSDDYLKATVYESEPAPSAESQHGGYNQSKWVGEQLALIARERGLPVAIYRPARITGDSQSGCSNLDDYFNSWIKGCVQLGMAPSLPAETFDMAPVNYVASAIVKIALGAGESNGNFHFLNPHRLPVAQIFSSLRNVSIEVNEVSYAIWRKALQKASQLSNDNALSRFASLFPEVPDPREPKFSCEATEQCVAEFGIVCPPADEELFEVYLNYMLQQNFFPADSFSEVNV